MMSRFFLMLERSVHQFAQKRFFVALAFVALLIFLPFAAHAQDLPAGDTATNLVLVLLASMFNAIAWGLGQFLVLIMGMVIIPILGYDAFGDSYIVSIGWPLVRDVVNMGVILILLWMAIKTMIGSSGGAQAIQQQLPKLFLAVIAVNFSRTICLLVIDASQVVMFTFVNALTQIAAGNFVNLLQINELLSFKNITGPGAQFNAIGAVATSYLSMVMISVILATFILLALVFIYRIVILWILIILSPIAFFMKGIEGIGPSAGGKGAEWWSKFTGAVMLGPVLTFFLWLALAASSQGGGLAASENFPVPDTELQGEWSELLTEAFQVGPMLSMLIGLAIIIVGFQVASSYAASVGGIAAKFITEDFGKSLVKGAAILPAKYAGKAAVGAAKMGGREFERRTGAFSTIGRDLTRFGGTVQQGGGIAGVVAGAAIAAGGAGLQRRAEAVSEADKKAAAEAFKTSTPAERQNMLDLHAAGKAPATTQGQEQQRLALLSFMSDKDEQAKRKATLKPEVVMKKDEREKFIADEQAKGLSKDEAVKAADVHDEGRVNDALEKEKANVMRTISANKSTFIGDNKERQKQWKEMQMRNLHLVTDKEGKFDAKEAQKIIDDPEFKPNMLSENSVADPNVQKLLETKVMSTYKDQYGNTQTETASDQIKAGKAGSGLKEVYEGKGAKLEKSSADTLGGAFRNGYIALSAIKPEHVEREEVVEGLAKADTDLSIITNPAVLQKLKDEFEKKQNDPTANAVDVRKYQKARVALAQPADVGDVLNITISGGSITEGGTPLEQANRSYILKEITTKDPMQISKFEIQINHAASTGINNSVTREVAQNVTVAHIDSLEKEYQKALQDKNIQKQGQIRKALEGIDKSLKVDIKEITSKPGQKPSREHQAKADKAEQVLRYVAATGGATPAGGAGPTTPPPAPATGGTPPPPPTPTPGPTGGGTP